MGLFTLLSDTIYSYTGLSPVAFFTILALMVGIYHLVSGMFVSPEAIAAKTSLPPEPELPPGPIQIGEVTLDELRTYDGSDPKKPLLMAIKGNIYDVSRSRMFYGPGGPYALFAGRETSRALALMSFDHNDLTSNLDGLSASELEVLQDWEEKFKEKYVKVGHLVSEGITNSDNNLDDEKAGALQEPGPDTKSTVESLESK
ncbi:Membrane steroid-binding protein 2 [Apostasia shenzhenica]|uniref:Membrane steroid-binding protein 2 n=1 Tax=Apostasia shenzhenica TaxID=1088818 RepID=A0A2I0B237_9ASPA|nr:Membrane steroid-binding protein 2 [Apostasia shenzhenica]